MREKVKEYLFKLDAEIKRYEYILNHSSELLEIKVQIQTLSKVKNDLQSMLEEEI